MMIITEAMRTHQARLLAEFAHANQLYGDRPYMEHLHGVAEIARNSHAVNDIGLDYVLQVAYLHDILEDTKVTLEFLAGFFSTDVCRAVSLLTKRDDVHYLLYIENIKKNRLALLVKIADTLYNLQQSALNKNAKRIKKYTEQLIALTE